MGDPNICLSGDEARYLLNLLMKNNQIMKLFGKLNEINVAQPPGVTQPEIKGEEMDHG